MATFTDLARGKGMWDGQLELSVDLSPANDRMVSAQFTSLPVLVPDDILRQKHSVRKRSRMTSASSARSFRSDRELLLPKTYTTRKGALVLFTPPGEFSLTEFDKVYLNKAFSDNYIDYVDTFGSLARLAQSVLMYGDDEKEEDDTTVSDTHTKTHMKFLHTPHDNMIDMRSQPGGDVSEYLRELRSTRCSTTSSYKATTSDDGKETTVEDSWSGDTVTPVTTTDMVTVDGDTLIGHYTTPVSHVSITMSPERPQSSSPTSTRQISSGERLMTSMKIRPYHVGDTILDDAFPAELDSNEVGSPDDLDLFPPYDGVQAIAGSRTDYSDDYSVATMHSLERSTPGGLHIDVGDAAQPLVPVYGDSFQANGGTWFAHETSPCQLASASVSSDGSVRDDSDSLNVIKVEVTSHPSSDVSSAPTVQSKTAADSTGQRKSEKRQPHPPSMTALMPDLLTRPPHPPTVPLSASRRSSMASMRSYQSGGSNPKTKSDITERMADSESSSTHAHMGALQRQRSRSKSAARRESVGQQSIKTKRDNQVTGAGLDVVEQLKSRERQAGDMVSEVGQADKLESEVDKTAAIGGREKELEDDALVSTGSKPDAKLKRHDLADAKSADAKTPSEEGVAKKTTEAGSLFDITKGMTQGVQTSTETGKKGAFEKITKKKVIKKTRKNEEMRQKRMSIIAEKEALREARRLEKQQALENAAELQRQIQAKEDAKAKLAEEREREKERLQEQLAEARRVTEAKEAVREAKEAEKKVKEDARRVAREERDARRRAEAERKKEAAAQRRSTHKELQEAARQKEADMLGKIASGEQRKRDAEEEGRRRRTKDEEMARMKEEEELKYKAMLATQRDADRLTELQMKAEVDEMNKLIQEKEEADKRAEMIRRQVDRLQDTDFDMQMVLVERQLAEHEDAEFRHLVKEQKVVRAEIERRKKLQREQEEEAEKERHALVRNREMTIQRQSYNLEQSTHLRNMKVQQGISRPWTFSYYVAWPLATYSKFGSCDVQGKGMRKKSGKKGKKGRKHKGKK